MDTSNFVFIQEMGTGSHEPVTKSLIKMHVMDRVVMQRRARKDDDDDSRSQTTAHKRRHQPIPIECRAGHGNLQTLAGIDDMLRLSGLSVEMSTQTRLLLHHFLYHRSKTLCTVTAETGWLKYAVQDDALFTTTLYYWAFINYDFLPANFQSEKHLLALKTAAIRTLALHLQTSTGNVSGDNEIVRDATIATVACLANVNFLCGDIEEGKVHFEALKAMIKSRKGVLHLGFQGLAARIVRWTDSCHSQLSNIKLTFNESFDPAEPIFPDAQISHLQPYKLAMIHELRLISNELIATPRDSMASDRRVSVGFRLLASDRSMLKYVHEANGSSVSVLVARSALIYSHAVLRGGLRSSRIIRTLVDQLKQLIISAFASRGDIFVSHPMALVWVLLVGVLASGRENIQGTWFRLCLEKACGNNSGLPWSKVEEITDAPNNVSPQPFYWLLEEIRLRLPCVNTSILC